MKVLCFIQHFFYVRIMEANLIATLVGHQNPIYTLASSYDSRFLFTAGNDKGIVEWDLEKMTFTRILCAVPASVYFLHVIPNTKILAAALRSGDIYLIDIDKQELITSLKVDSGAVFALRTLPSGKEIMATGEDGCVYVWSLEDYTLLRKEKISNNTVRVIEISTDDKHVIFGDKNGDLHSFSLPNFKHIQSKHVHSRPVTALLADNGKLFSGGRDAKMNVLTLPYLEKERSLVPHMFTVYGIAKHPSKDWLATVSRDKTTKIWCKDDLRLLKNISIDRKYDAHLLSINACIWSDYKDWLISISDDKLVKIWEISE